MSKEFDLVGHTERRIDKVRLAVVGGLVGGKGYACIDNFLGNDICAQLRAEAVHQFETDRMVNPYPYLYPYPYPYPYPHPTSRPSRF